jgi:hypothetical protein
VNNAGIYPGGWKMPPPSSLRRSYPLAGKGNTYSVFYRVSFRFHRDKSRRYSPVAPLAQCRFASVFTEFTHAIRYRTIIWAVSIWVFRKVKPLETKVSDY